MKILLVSTQDYIHHPVPSRHHYLFEKLATRHEVHVPHFHVSHGKERTTQLVVHEATKFPFREPLLHYTANAPYQYAVFKKIIREDGIDIVVAAHIFAGAAVIHAARKYGIPVLFDLSDWFPDSAAAYYNNTVLKWLLRKGVWSVTKYNLDRSDMITTVSPSLVKRLYEYGYTAELITNGVDTDLFKPFDPQAGKRMLGIDENSFVLGFAGSLERWYALDEVIRMFPEVMHRHEDAQLLIVGGSLFTDYETELKRLAKEQGVGDRVLFTGLVGYEELPRYISAMDVGLIPLAPPQWRNIALPNKFFEYSACGKPILSTPIPDMMKIGGEQLYIYETREDFLEQLGRIRNTPKKLTIDVREHSWTRKAEEMERLLERCIAR